MPKTVLHCMSTLLNSVKLGFCVSFFFFVVGVNAQSVTAKEPLITVLKKVQNKFPYVFTYVDDMIESQEVIFPPDHFSFNQILEYLAQRTGLVFRMVGENFVVISKKSDVLVCGFVRNNANNLPLKGCDIKSENTTATTNENGYFELLLGEEKEMLIIQSPGYTDKYKLSNTFNDSCSTIYLEPQIEFLQEVILKDYLVKGISKTIDGNFLIDYQDFDILPGLIETDVLQTIQALPGISSADETVSNINIRGGTHDQNLIHWDGIKMYQSGHFFGLISAFDPNITKTVKLIKNGTDAEYTDGVSGTILMETDNQINADISASLGVDLINASGFVDLPIGKKSSLQVAARKSINDFVETSTYSQYFNRILQGTEVKEPDENVLNSDIEFDFYDTSLRWLYKLSPKDEIRVNFITITNTLQFTENASVGAINTSKQSSLDQNSIAGGVFYRRKWSNKLKSTFQLYETDYQLKAINVNVLDGQQFLQKNKVSETSAKLVLDYNLHKNIVLHTGYQWTETGIINSNKLGESLFRQNSDEVIRIHGVFSGLEYKSDSKNTSLKAGLRYNYNEKFNSHNLEPRVSYFQKFLDYWKLEVSGEYKHQNTSHNINFQNDFLGIEKRRWVLSNNEDIPVLRSKQASLGLHFEKQGWLFSMEAYYKTVKGITTKSQGFLNQYSSVNETGKYNTHGIDLMINKKVDNFYIWSNYTWALNDYTFRRLEDTNFPNTIDGRHSFGLGSSYALKELKIAAGLNWKSGLPTTRPVDDREVVGSDINFGPAHANRIGSYLRLDVSVIYDFNIGKKIKIHSGVSVWNFLNKQNILSEYYQLTNDNTVRQVFRKSLVTTPNAKLRILF